MRCEEVREQVDELWVGKVPVEAREHLAQCSACESYFRDLRLLRAGFRVLAEEELPEPSLGFVARVVRRLGEVDEQGAAVQFFENVGRRFVYATLALTLGLLLALIVPSSGPVRGPVSADVLLAQSEVETLRPDVVMGADAQDNPDLQPLDMNRGNGKEPK